MFAADLEAAFDSLDHQFLLSVLKYFGFKSNFIKWIKILHHNIQSTIVNNGFTTGYCILERGTRQGDPLACYLFIISMEILATLIRNNQDIAGINIHGLEVKICMFADDTTIFVKNTQSLKAVLKVLSEFAMVSSLNINKNKSNAALIGKSRNKKDTNVSLNDINWIDLDNDAMKILGFYYSYNNIIVSESNFKKLETKGVNVWEKFVNNPDLYP